MNVRLFSALMLALTSFILIGCDENDEPNGEKSELKFINLTGGELAVAKQNNMFAWNMFDYVNAESGNTIVSPLSASFAMCMTAEGANGATRDEIYQAFGFENCNNDDVNSYMHKLSNQLMLLDSKTEVSIANSLWHNKRYNILESFISSMKTSYNADVFQLGTNAEDDINDWCSDKTHGYINDLIPQGSITPSTAAVLLNALYFKGEWADKFDKKDTERGFFYSIDNSLPTVYYMTGRKKIEYVTAETFTMAGLEFGNGAYAARFLLPNKDKTFDDCINEIKTIGWESIKNNYHSGKTTIKIPKFTMKNRLDMMPIYQQMGIDRAFSLYADFSNLSTTEDLCITDAFQSNYFKIDEEGATAASVSGVLIGDAAPISIPSFILDHPFIFALTEQSTGAILFIGKVEKL